MWWECRSGRPLDERSVRGLYAGLGTRFGTYSLAECVSDDGLIWIRGPGDENVSLAPQPGSWDSGMTGYPAILDEGDTVRVFYNGAAAERQGSACWRLESCDHNSCRCILYPVNPDENSSWPNGDGLHQAIILA